MFRAILTRLRPLIFLVGILALAATELHCGSTQNPASLWINYGQREINLILVDFEPPPF